MIPPRVYEYTVLPSIPRESGDDPPTMTLYDLVYAYSPRERG